MGVFVETLIDLFTREMDRRRPTVSHAVSAGGGGLEDALFFAVFHRMRTKLSSVLGPALTLEARGGSLTEADSRELLRTVARSARELHGLLSDLLDLDQLQRGVLTPDREPTDLLHLARATVERFDRDHPPIIVQGEHVHHDVDQWMVERIITNLIMNARQHTPRGTGIWVRVAEDPEGARLTVEDDGPGVPVGMRTQMFQPFRRGASASTHDPGAGIGLTLVARLAELHHGRAWLTERPGGGVAVHVLLGGASR